MLALKIDPPPLSVDARGTVRVGGTRVTLETVIGAHKRGDSPQAIVESYPSLDLADVYGVIGYYLRNRADVDAYLAAVEREAERMRSRIEAQPGYAAVRDRVNERRQASRRASD